KQIVRDHGFEHVALPVEPSSTLLTRPVRFANRLWQSAQAASALLPSYQASVVIGLGGFASVPVVWAARLAGIPLILLEQNVVPGRATSWLCRRANLTCLGFADAARRLPQRAAYAVTGNPVRQAIAGLADEAPSDGTRQSLVVLGGSQGSLALNDAFLGCVEHMTEQFADWQIVHQTGARDAQHVRRRYDACGIKAEVASFFDDPVALYRTAALVVSRAGALTLSELACAGVPAVLIPYPKAIRNHQRLNAYTFEHVGAARVVRQSRDPERTCRHLQEELAALLSNADLRSRMARAMRSLARPDAAAVVADKVCEFLFTSQAATQDSVSTESRAGDR
ncbi:MAG TPA: UDP-N-acetylglucosamine--N-acetylmuramyl-(pentapeptide) pyrophosphoryl-undecaprenol N-acetylglucosamine transferase, partial [Pirellulales bacterium]|nr:UDP-N-acetylglucosamine--N-acetylmuramyl-(pentapeptide) pyrophosphoryl-undecaprenol N-acetylglucosamine transferase [Pirellulales bacterium]